VQGVAYGLGVDREDETTGEEPTTIRAGLPARLLFVIVCGVAAVSLAVGGEAALGSHHAGGLIALYLAAGFVILGGRGLVTRVTFAPDAVFVTYLFSRRIVRRSAIRRASVRTYLGTPAVYLEVDGTNGLRLPMLISLDAPARLEALRERMDLLIAQT